MSKEVQLTKLAAPGSAYPFLRLSPLMLDLKAKTRTNKRLARFFLNQGSDADFSFKDNYLAAGHICIAGVIVSAVFYASMQLFWIIAFSVTAVAAFAFYSLVIKDEEDFDGRKEEIESFSRNVSQRIKHSHKQPSKGGHSERSLFKVLSRHFDVEMFTKIGKYCPDILLYLNWAVIDIEIDECYYEVNDIERYPIHCIKSKKDKKREDLLLSKGISILRVSESQALMNPEEIVSFIMNLSQSIDRGDSSVNMPQKFLLKRWDYNDANALIEAQIRDDVKSLMAYDGSAKTQAISAFIEKRRRLIGGINPNYFYK